MVKAPLLPTLLAALMLAGCGAPVTSGAAVRGGLVSAASAEAEPWVHPADVSTPDDPAIAGDLEAEKSKATGELIRFAKVDDRLYRGGLPSLANLKELKAKGIKTDITLMGEIPLYDTAMVLREKLWAKQAGLKFVQVKVPTGKMPIGPKISNKYADAFLKVVLDPANQPAFVHCLHGRDRTGTMVSTYRISQGGFTNAQAYAEMKSFGFSETSYPKLAAFVQAYVPTPGFKIPGAELLTAN